MSYPVECQRLRIGGTVSGSTITGGTLIETLGKNLQVWDGVLNGPSRQVQPVRAGGRDGSWVNAGGASEPGPYWRERYQTLQVVAFDRDDDGLITHADGRCAELEQNMDEIAELFLSSEDLVVLERDMADGSTRFIEVMINGAPFPVTEGPVWGADHASWLLQVGLIAPWPFWQGKVEKSLVVPGGGGDTLTNVGTAPIGNAQFSFAGATVLEHTEYSATLTATGACDLDLRRSRAEVTQGGVRADNLLKRSHEFWQRYPRSPSAVSTLTSSAAAVTITYRDQFLL